MSEPRVPTSEDAKKLLMEVTALASPPELPDSLLENCKRVWEAFALGEAYERLWAKEHDKASKED